MFQKSEISSNSKSIYVMIPGSSASENQFDGCGKLNESTHSLLKVKFGMMGISPIVEVLMRGQANCGWFRKQQRWL